MSTPATYEADLMAGMESLMAASAMSPGQNIAWSEAERDLRNARDKYIRQQSLPPEKAPELSRADVLDFLKCEGLQADSGDMSLALVGGRSQHSKERLEDLRKSKVLFYTSILWLYLALTAS